MSDFPRVGHGSAPVWGRGTRPADGAHGTYVVKVGDDLVEEPQAFQALLVHVRLCVELLEVRNGGEHDADTGIGLVVELLRAERRAAFRGARSQCKRFSMRDGWRGHPVSCPPAPPQRQAPDCGVVTCRRF